MSEPAATEICLLPPTNVTALEAALDLGVEAPMLATPAPIADLWSPDRCPAELLEWLAWGLGVDLWDADWSEGRKRRMCREVWGLKRLKGTLEGAKRTLAFLDAEVVATRLPPQRIFARSADPARQMAFDARFAALRIFAKHGRSPAPGRQSYAGGVHFIGSATLGPVARVNTAAERYGRRAVIVDDGVETELDWKPISSAVDLTVIDPEAVERVTARAKAHHSDFLIGRTVLGRGFAQDRAPRSRILTIAPNRAPETSGCAVFGADEHGLTPIERAPRRRRLEGARSARQAQVGAFVGMVARPNQAPLRIFDCYRLLDPARMTRQEGEGLGPFLGSMRLGSAPYRAHLRIKAQARRTGRAAHVGGFVGMTARPPAGRFDRISKGIRASAVYRDTVTFSTRTREPLGFRHAPKFEDAPVFGAFVTVRTAA